MANISEKMMNALCSVRTPGPLHILEPAEFQHACQHVVSICFQI